MKSNPCYEITLFPALERLVSVLSSRSVVLYNTRKTDKLGEKESVSDIGDTDARLPILKHRVFVVFDRVVWNVVVLEVALLSSFTLTSFLI